MIALKKNKLVLNFFSLGFVQGLIGLLQLIVIPHVIKKVGIEGFGVIAIAQVVISYLSALNDYGFNQTATRQISISGANRITISKIFFNVLFCKLILCFFSFMILLFLLLIVPVFRQHSLLYLMGFIFVIGQSSMVSWFFQGLEKMRLIALLNLGGRIIFAVLVFVFIKNKSQDFLFLFFLGSGTLIAGSTSIFIAVRLFHLKFIKPSTGDIIHELKEGWHVTIANLSSYTSQYANIFILRIFTNDLLVGYYSIAERLFLTIKQVLVVFSQVAYPRVCQLAQKGSEDIFAFGKRIYIPFLLTVITGCLVLFVFSPQLLYFFMQHEYFHSVFYLRMFCIVLVIVCLNIPSTLILLAMEYKKSYFYIITLGMILNILSNIILAYFFNATGTVVSILLTELFIAFGLGLRMLGYLKFKKIVSSE